MRLVAGGGPRGHHRRTQETGLAPAAAAANYEEPLMVVLRCALLCRAGVIAHLARILLIQCSRSRGIAHLSARILQLM